MSKFYVSIDGL